MTRGDRDGGGREREANERRGWIDGWMDKLSQKEQEIEMDVWRDKRVRYTVRCLSVILLLV